MYVCLCNGLKDSDFLKACEDKPCERRCAASAFKSLGCKPQCGKCVTYVQDYLAASSNTMAVQTAN